MLGSRVAELLGLLVVAAQDVPVAGERGFARERAA